MSWSVAQNPVLVRELQSTLRTRAFPRVLALAAGIVYATVLLIAMVAMQSGADPAENGRLLFQTYFGVAYALVALVSAVYGAGAISRDAESGALEAITLTNLSPAAYVKGKLTALYATTLILIVACAPASVVSLLFGGVSPGELVIGTLVLALVARVGIAFGLAVSARIAVARWSLVLTVALVIPAAGALLTLVTALGAARHWSGRFNGPFWFTSDLVSGIGPQRAVFLLALPAMAFGALLWLLRCAAIAPLLPGSEDRWRAYRVWVPGAFALVVAGTALARSTLGGSGVYTLGLVAASVALAVGLVGLFTLMGAPARAREGHGSAGGGLLLTSLVGLASLGSIVLLVRIGTASGRIFLSVEQVETARVIATHLPWIAAHLAMFLALSAALAFACRQLLPTARGARIVAALAIATLGGVVFLAESANSSTLSTSLVGQLSPFYALTEAFRDRQHLAEPVVAGSFAAVVLVGLGLARSLLRKAR